MTTASGQRFSRRRRGGAHGRALGLLAGCVALAAVLAMATLGQAAGTFTQTTLTGDADCGVASYKTYTHAYDTNGSNRYVNGVLFTGTGGSPSGTNFSTTGWASTTSLSANGKASQVTGAIGSVVDGFCYGVDATYGWQTLALTGLTVGEHYVTTFYCNGWGDAAVPNRIEVVSTSDGGETLFDEDIGGLGVGSMLVYDYVAWDTSLTYTIMPYDGTNSFHLFGFTNEVYSTAEPLVFDTFDASGITDRHDLNYNLSVRQTGTLANAVTYSTPTGANVQLGNAAFRAGSDNLMLTWDTSVSPDVNFNGSYAEGGLKISFSMTPDAVGSGTDSMVAGIALGMSQANRFSDADASTAHFGIVFGSATGAFTAYDGATVVGTSSAALWSAADAAMHDFVIELTDATDGNPLDGSGQTTIEVLVDDTSVFTWTKTGGGYTNNYINLQASEVALFDSLGIVRLGESVTATAVPEPSTLALLAGALALLIARRIPRRAALVAGLVLALAAGVLAVGAQAAGVFTTSTFTGDSDCGISGEKCYMSAYNFATDGILDVNGAIFTGSGYSVTNPANHNGSLAGNANLYHGWTTYTVTGNAGLLLQNFIYGGMTESSVTLNNLRIGQEYVASFINGAWDNPASSPRWMTITVSDGGSGHLDESYSGQYTGNRFDYTFTAESTSLTFTLNPDNTTNQSFHYYAFTTEVVGYKPLLVDTFEAVDVTDQSDLTNNLANRQGGSVEQVTYTKKSGSTVQLGNTSLAAEFGTSLLVRDNSIVSPDYNFDGTSAAGGLLISFDLAPDALGSSDGMLAGINLGMSEANRLSSLAASASHFGIRFDGEVGAFVAYDGATQVGSGTSTWTAPSDGGPQMHHFELLLTDSTDGNPLDGSGQTTVNVYVDGNEAFAYTKTGGGYADNYLNFEVNRLAMLDNLIIAQGSGGTPPAHPGDANRDGMVNDLDASILATNWQLASGATWDKADFNGDGMVTDLDASILAANWQYGVGSAVPEPATWILLAGLGLAWAVWSKRSR